LALVKCKKKPRFPEFEKSSLSRVEDFFLFGKDRRHPTGIVFLYPPWQVQEISLVSFRIDRNDNNILDRTHTVLLLIGQPGAISLEKGLPMVIPAGSIHFFIKRTKIYKVIDEIS
jgi:hypothetical protein